MAGVPRPSRPKIPGPGLIAALILILLGVLAYTQFELYPRSRGIRPSREVRANDYLALERWLVRTGHPVRVKAWADPAQINGAPEKIVFIQDSAFTWTENAFEELEPWILRGGVLFLSLDTPWYEDENIARFLSRLGLHRDLMYYDVTPEDIVGLPEPEDADEHADPFPATDIPDLDWYVRFNFIEGTEVPAEAGVIGDPQKGMPLITLPWGQGWVTVTGQPYFMQNLYIDSKKNARLSWDVTGMRDQEHRGALFIRGNRVAQGLFGNLANRGKPLPLILSLVVLLITGFWMVIPVFGRFRREESRPGKPLRERFLAEGRFLKKYQSLETYLAVYNRELRLKLRRRGYYREAEQDKRIAEILGSAFDPRSVAEALNPQHRRDNSRKFIERQEILETLWERL